MISPYLRLFILLGVVFGLLGGCSRHNHHTHDTRVVHHYDYPGVVYLQLADGSFYYRGRAYRFHQHAIELKRGETKKIVLTGYAGKRPRTVTLFARYDKGKVVFGDGKRILHSIDFTAMNVDADNPEFALQ